MIYKIVDAYIELLTSIERKKISVTTICSFCGIHRSSFYRYFEDIEDLDAKFLAVLYDSRNCAKDFRPGTVSEMIDYLVSIVAVMKNYSSLFNRMKAMPDFIQYRVRWSILVRDNFLPWWPRNRYSFRHPLLDARLYYTVGLIDTFIDYAFESPLKDARSLAFILIEYMTGGRLRVIEKSKDIDREVDATVDQIYQEEVAVFEAAKRWSEKSRKKKG